MHFSFNGIDERCGFRLFLDMQYMMQISYIFPPSSAAIGLLRVAVNIHMVIRRCSMLIA